MSNKIKKRESFKMIIEVLENNDRADLVEVMNHEIELLDKKKASGKMTKTQTENVGIKEIILHRIIAVCIGFPETCKKYKAQAYQPCRYHSVLFCHKGKGDRNVKGCRDKNNIYAVDIHRCNSRHHNGAQ